MRFDFSLKINSIIVATLSIPVVLDGAMGVPGPAYQPLRTRAWAEIPNGERLQTGLGEDDQWTDIVYEADSGLPSGFRYWKCVKSFTKEAGQTPPKNGETNNPLNGYLIWNGINYAMVATDILLANYAVFKNLGVEAIEMYDSGGNLKFLAKDGEVTCNTGNFKNIHISGSSTFKGFTLKEKFEVTSTNYSEVIKTVDLGYGESRNEIDLLKTGPWIEFKYAPGTVWIYMPTIRVGVAYSDAYRDYVRQFLGNEVLIYNSTKSALAVDSGANSIQINPDMAIHLKMVMAAEKMDNTGNLLERIKWEWTNPFQF